LGAFRDPRRRFASTTAKVDANIVFIWASTHASIPTGWSEDTQFAGKHVLAPAAGTDGGGTGGDTTHVHPNSAAHIHTVSGGATGGSSTYPLGANGVGGPTHTHASFNSGSGTTVYGATSNEPPYYEIIYIKSDGTGQLDSNIIGFFDNAVRPAGWDKCDGNNGTPLLGNRFLKGVAAGGDAGVTGGSSDSHVHTSSHTHAAIASSQPTGTATVGGAAANPSTNKHTHSVSLNSGTANVLSNDATPPHYFLLAIQNNSGSESLPDGIIGLWPYSNATIPTNWTEVAGIAAYFARVTNADGSIGATGGSNQHTHSCTAHNHSATAAAGAAGKGDPPGTVNAANAGHTHVWTVGNNTQSASNNTSQSAYPEYIKAIFIKYNG
jgi:hypothetical protein